MRPSAYESEALPFKRTRLAYPMLWLLLTVSEVSNVIGSFGFTFDTESVEYILQMKYGDFIYLTIIIKLGRQV